MKAREIILCGLFITLVAAGAFIRIPVGADVYTLQFLFTLLAGIVLGPRLGALAVGTYVLMGIVGIPVFASGGGPGYILQPTFGYLVGFILQAYATGALTRRKPPTFRNVLWACTVGMGIVYLLGIAYFYFASNYIIHVPIGFWVALWYCGVLQVVPDFILCLAATYIGLRLHKAGLWLTERKGSRG
ncbi:MAG: biotin transporter BioY [Veillonellaceae bacterium]|nr:biotin transporter BioY [Veillonellaceae bacterium]